MKRLLLVDDSPAVRTIFKLYLSVGPYKLLEAEDAERALKIARLQPVDLILADFSMPGTSGLELFEKIRAAGNTTTALVLITASQDPQITTKARTAGADDVLMKPITPDALLSAVARALALHHPA